MLQREGFVVADMSASTPSPSPLERSSWKAEAIRRGNLKISGPIPITEDVPLNEEEEKEYAANGALDRTLQPQDAPEEQYERPQTPPRPLQSPPPVPEQHMSALRSNPVGEQQPQRDSAVPERPISSRSPPRVRHLDEVQRESIVPSTSIASPSPFRSTPESAGKAAQKKNKRKSGLRNVFRKMFGRKGPDRADDLEEEPMQRGHSYHHSDTTMLRSTPPREPRTPPSNPRISDLPVEELQPLHPLGQHLPYPMNVNAPPASPPKEYLTFDTDRPDLGRRRATLPTVPSAITHRHSFDEPREKLAAWDEQAEEDEMSPGIGIALSSPTQTVTSKHDRRRSRSADALHNLAKERASTERGRSAEIKFWRESYMSGSIYSRPQTAKTVETVRTVPMQEPMIREPDNESFNEMSATLVQADESQTATPITEEPNREQERSVQPPVSAFNFGDLKNALFGPKEETIPESPQVRSISPPPPPPAKSQHRIPIEDRVQDLESRYSNLETLTRRMSSRNNRQTIILENAPRNLRSRNRSSSASASRSHSRSAPSIHQELIVQSSSETLEPEPAPGSPTLAGPPVPHTGSNEENARALRNVYEALRHERSARKALEQQVRTLQHDVSDLHALVNKLIVSATATSPSYPTPSPDTLIISREGDQRISCSTPRAPAHDRNIVYGQPSHDRNQRWANDDASVYSEDLARKPSYDDVSPEVWATPKEEGFDGSGFFHGDDRVGAYA
ncbi:hypothetical protein J4E90_010747 [Alternaria incomplexa]|uniref:uncharacterized protein n=1 Tax=Alternaria incomplexa TaxID=1187928 RepID=UPI00221EAF5C|nr:uncharacterized protein J4E90_010747 [Alternaria incomplexa]KAI4906274.1 hypothetical protein J4E90_010747 [Alternaria incomplexa]